jgi:hypothetical protein
MTYIKKDRRAALDTIIEGLVNRLRSIDPVRSDLSYTVTRIVLESLRPADGWTRQALADCVASLYEASDEIQRRMTDPFGDTELRINGDLACFQEEWNKPKTVCKCPTSPPQLTEGIFPPFNVKGAITGRTDGSGENACFEVPKASPSLAPGMTLEDLGVVGTKDGEIKPITEALTDEQIEEAELERSTTVSFMYSDKLQGVTAYRPYTGVGTLLPNDISFGPNIDPVISEVIRDRDLDKWVKDIPIKAWRRMVSEGTPYETGEE